MTAVTVGQGDAVSKLLQVLAKDIGIKDIKFIGKGMEDAKNILTQLHNSKLITESLWTGLTELYQMPQMKEFPEPIQAQLMAIILTAKAKIELGSKA